MRIHCLYRSTGVENQRARPPYYSKDLALTSFVRAIEQCSDVGDVLFVNDGRGVPDRRRAQMHAAGEVIDLEPARGNGGSYRFLLALTEQRSWSPDDLVYFAEDDYLYVDEALTALVHAARGIPRAGFFTLYDHTDHYDHPVQLAFARRHRRDRWTVGAHEWRAVRSTTLTFAARLATVRDQLWLHFLGTDDHPADDYIWGASQTFTGRALIPMVFRCTNPRNRRSVNVKRVGLLLQAYAKRRRNDLLVAPTRSLATHMQEPFVAPGVDWSARASALDAT